MNRKPLITITIVDRDTYARRIAQRACRTQNDEIQCVDPKLAAEIAVLLAESGADTRVVREVAEESDIAAS